MSLPSTSFPSFSFSASRAPVKKDLLTDSSSRNTKRKRRSQKKTTCSAADQPVLDHAILNFIMLDREGDKLNRLYASLNKYQVPRYRRLGGGQVMGLPSYLHIDEQQLKNDKQLSIVYRGTSSAQRITDTQRSTSKSYHFVHRQNTPSHSTFRSDFIALLASDSDSNDDAQLSSHNEHHTIQTLTTNERKVAITHEARTVQRIRDYNTRLQLDPHNISLWLEFISFQDEQLLNNGKLQDLSNTRSINEGLKRGSIEKKLSIFERALMENPSNEQLLCAYMLCAHDIWEPEQILIKYKSLLRDHPSHYRLTLDYLSFRQTSSSAFTVPICQAMYEECLENLILLVNTITQHQLENFELLTLHIWLRAVNMLWQSGYNEIAIAIIQAQIDYSFHFPTILANASESEIMESFSLYWESGVAKFGEPGAAGWAAFLNGHGNVLQMNQLKQTTYQPRVHDIFGEWARQETESELTEWLPRRLIDDELDPYGVVFFEDVRPFLFPIQSQSVKKQLLHTIFYFFHIITPITRFTSEFTSDPLLDTSLLPPHATQQFWKQAVPNLPGITLDINDIIAEQYGHEMKSENKFSNEVGNMPLKMYAMSTDTLLSSNQKSKELNTWPAMLQCHQQDHTLLSTFLKESLQQCTTLTGLDDGDLLPMRLLWLSYEYAMNSTCGRTCIRSLLKEHSLDLSLWCTYAILESSSGDCTEARKVYSKILSMKDVFSSDQWVYWPLVYLSFAEMEWQLGHSDKALHILVHQVDEQHVYTEITTTSSLPKLRPITLVKTKKYYHQMAFAVLASVPPFRNVLTQSIALAPLMSLGLFTYLIKGYNETHSIYKDMLNTLKVTYPKECQLPINPTSYMYSVRELIYQHWVKIAYHHSRKGGMYQPKLLRDVCDAALKEFPVNSLIWEIYMWNESKMRVEMHLRRVLNTAITHHPTHLIYLISSYAELHKQQRYNPNVIRSLFEQAVESPAGRHSVNIWKMYILSEVQLGATNHLRIRGTLFRAIRECPWCKELYVLAYRECREFLTLHDLYEIWGFMEEKEIRIRTELISSHQES